MNDKVDYTLEELEQHRKDFIEALRSGKYKQGFSALRLEDDCFCVLGVACEVSGVKVEARRNFCNELRYYYDESSSTMPEKVKEYYGFLDHMGSPSCSSPTLRPLFIYNDKFKMSFEEIATIVETNMEKYFTNA